MTTLRRRAVALARRIDFAAGRAWSSRRVLVEARTPMNLAVLAPVWRRLLSDARIDVRFTGYPRDDLARAYAEAGIASRAVSRSVARLPRWDLYMNADPWDPAPLLRCRRRINFFHGVAGKYDLECPANLPLDLALYDCIAFPNSARMRRYLAARLVRADQARLVGFPKLDALVNSAVSSRAAAARLGLDPARPTAIYAPTFGPQSSLQDYGEPIVRTLLDAGLNAIVKLHDRSFDPDPKYSGGSDWRARLSGCGGPGRFVLASGADSTEYLLASDVMVTDHSTVGFEFCALDRPVVVFDVPELLVAARVDPERVRLLRTAADVVNRVSDVRDVVERALQSPAARRPERRAACREVFHDPGRATERALAVCYELMECPTPVSSACVAGV